MVDYIILFGILPVMGVGNYSVRNRVPRREEEGTGVTGTI